MCCIGAPPDLVQIVHGYAEAGNALVTGGVNKVIFVGSTGVGKAVMQVGGQICEGLVRYSRGCITFEMRWIPAPALPSDMQGQS